MNKLFRYLPGIFITCTAFAGLSVVLLARYEFIHIDNLEPISADEVAEVRATCDSIIPPDGLRLVSKDYLTEWDRAGVFMQFDSATDPRKLVDQIISTIDRTKWSISKESKNGLVKQYFYHGKFYITVSYDQIVFTGKGIVWLDCGWRNQHY